MRAIQVLTVLVTVLAVAGCGKKVVEGDKTVERGGLLYEINSETPFTGIVIGKYQNGQKKFEVGYRDGKEEGKTTCWHMNGQKSYEVEYRSGKEEGKRTGWHENGQKAEEVEFRNGERDGKVIFWYENGQKKAETEFRDGKLEGKSTLWYENGQKKSEFEVRDGQEVSSTEWDENGNVKPR